MGKREDGEKRDLFGDGAGKPANEQRGRAYDGLARRLLERFPEGSVFADQVLDEFLYQEQWLTEPAPPRNSPGWAAHVRRREEAVRGIGKASSHPRMNEGEHYAYTLSSLRNGNWCIQRLDKVITSGRLIEEMERHVAGQKVKARYLAEGADPEALPPELQHSLRVSMQFTFAVLEDAIRIYDRGLKALAELRRPFESLTSGSQRIDPVEDGGAEAAS